MFNASMPNGMNFSPDDDKGGGARRRNSSSKRGKRSNNAVTSSMSNRMDLPHDSSNGSGNQKRGLKSSQNDKKTSKLTNDEECLLKAMPLLEIKALYFTEIGFFDWKKWRTANIRKEKRRKGARAKRMRMRRLKTDHVYEDEVDPRLLSTRPKNYPDQIDDHEHLDSLNDLQARALSPRDRHEDDPSNAPSRDSNLQKEGSLGFGDWTKLAQESEPFQDTTICDFGESRDDFFTLAEVTQDDTPLVPELIDRAEVDEIEESKEDVESETAALAEESADNEQHVLLVSTKEPASTLRLIGLDDNIDAAKEERPTELVRIDSAGRELAKLTQFMTTIDVLSNQEVAEHQAKENGEQSACCVIL